jgi:hypothetical protein
MNHFDADTHADPIKSKILVKDSSKDAFFSNTGKPTSDATEKGIPTYHPDDSDALNRVPGWEAA